MEIQTEQNPSYNCLHLNLVTIYCMQFWLVFWVKFVFLIKLAIYLEGQTLQFHRLSILSPIVTGRTVLSGNLGKLSK